MIQHSIVILEIHVNSIYCVCQSYEILCTQSEPALCRPDASQSRTTAKNSPTLTVQKQCGRWKNGIPIVETKGSGPQRTSTSSILFGLISTQSQSLTLGMTGIAQEQIRFHEISSSSQAAALKASAFCRLAACSHRIWWVQRFINCMAYDMFTIFYNDFVKFWKRN